MQKLEKKLKFIYTTELKNHLELMKYYFKDIQFLKHKIHKLNSLYPFIYIGANNEKIQLEIINFLDYYFFLEKSVLQQKQRIQMVESSTKIALTQHHIRNKISILESKYFLINNELNQYSRILMKRNISLIRKE